MHKNPKLDAKMKTFQQYVIEHGDEVSPRGPTVPEDALVKIAHIAAGEHLDELLGFYETLARKDTRIRHELDIYRKDAGNNPSRQKDRKSHLPPSYTDDGVDTVVPSGADATGGFEPGGGQS